MNISSTFIKNNVHLHIVSGIVKKSPGRGFVLMQQGNDMLVKYEEERKTLEIINLDDIVPKDIY